MVNREYVKAYFNKWSNGQAGTAYRFLDMLQGKANLAGQTNDKLYAYDGLKSAQELNQMLCIADDMISEGALA